MENLLKSAFDRLRRGVPGWNPIGASAGAVDQIEQQLGVRVPSAYREFLSLVGEHPGGYMAGSDFTLSRVVPNQLFIREEMDDNGDTGLPADAIVFFSHGGYEFYFFRSSGGPDPAVWRYREGEGIRYAFDSFSEWFGDSVDYMIRHRRQR